MNIKIIIGVIVVILILLVVIFMFSGPYKGDFIDCDPKNPGAGVRAMPIVLDNSGKIDVATCIALGKKGNHKYVGLQWPQGAKTTGFAFECRAGDDYGKYGRADSKSVLKDKEGKSLGGPCINSVYAV